MKLSELKLTTEEEQQVFAEKRRENLDEQLVVCATFTAEPIKQYIHWWMKQFDVEIQIDFSPYNQVFQELLYESSLLSNNYGINLLLVRFEDWLRDDQSLEEEKLIKLEHNYQEFVNTFQNRINKTVCFCGIFPISAASEIGREIYNKISELTLQWQQVVAETDNAYILDFQELSRLYNIREVFDPMLDSIGHIPFSDEYFAAMGTTIARKIVNWKRQSFKVIVLDCDNTLWRGICGEVGPLGVTVDTPYLDLQKCMIQKQGEGMLLALCSKNNETDVWEVFSKNKDMVLRKEHLVSWKLNWRPKSENLKELAQELNVGLDSFIFLDDNSVEVAEVMSRCPEVLALRLPTDPLQFSGFLDHVWAFDRTKVTAEDKQRTRMYEQEQRRKEIQEVSLTLDDFIKSLGLKVSMQFIESDQVDRVSQLTQRTNQFNLSTIRRTESEIAGLANEPGVRLWVVEVTDRFGDYGLVGVIITKETNTDLFIDTFLLSCRVLGRKVEDAILSGLKNYCLKQNLNTITAIYLPTTKNEPIHKFLVQSGWKEKELKSESITYELFPDQISKLSNTVHFYYQSPIPEVISRRKVTSKITKCQNNPNPESRSIEVESKPDLNYDVFMVNEANLVHKDYLLPLQAPTARLLMKLPVHEMLIENISRAEYIAPTNEVEERIVAIWQEILGVEMIGINDNFFALGGHSLKALSIISLIHKALNVEIPLQEVFNNPTVKSLAEKIELNKGNEYIPVKKIGKREYYELGLEPKGLMLLRKYNKDQRGDNITLTHKIKSINKEAIQKTFDQIIQRHEILRSTFVFIDNDVKLKVHPFKTFKYDIEYVDNDFSFQFFIHNNHLSKFSQIVFNLEQGPLFAIKILNLKNDESLLVFIVMHIIVDAWSLDILRNEFARLYESNILNQPNPLPELDIQYKEYINWQNKLDEHEHGIKMKRYWEHVLKNDLPEKTLSHFISNNPEIKRRTNSYKKELAYELSKYVKDDISDDEIKQFLGVKDSVVPKFKGAGFEFFVDEKHQQLISGIILKENTTLFVLLLTCYNILCYKYSGLIDNIQAVLVAVRDNAEINKIIALMLNTIFIRNQIDENYNFIEFLKIVKYNFTEAFAFKSYPFQKVLNSLDMPMNIAPIQFNVHPAADIKLEPAKIIKRHMKQNGGPWFDTYCSIQEYQNCIKVYCHYDTLLFTANNIEKLWMKYADIINVVAENPDIKIKDI